MKTVSWRDLKDGDILKLVYPTSKEWQWNTGLGGGFDGRPFFRFMRGNLLRFPSETQAANLRYLSNTIEQQVQVYDQEEIGALDMLKGFMYDKACDTSGSDPEIFIVRGAKKELLPAFQFLPDKQEAAKLRGYNHAYAYRDGFAAESWVQAVGCHGYLIDYIRNGLGAIRSAARKHDRTAELSLQGTFAIPDEIMTKATDDQVALGCMPSKNAYGDRPALPTDGKALPLRFAGGHMHFGLFKKDEAILINMVKAADIISALPAVAIFNGIDQPARRAYYGRAGEFRTPAHGLEYRVLSNAWLGHPSVAHLMFNLTRAALKVGMCGYQDKMGLKEEEVREIINYNDVERARKWALNNVEFLGLLLNYDGAGNKIDKLKAIIAEGALGVFEDYTDIAHNWSLAMGQKWSEHSDADRKTWNNIELKLPEKPALAVAA